MVLVSQMSQFVKNFKMGIFSDTINIVSVRHCMMVLHIEHHLFITLSLFQVHCSVK